MTLARLKSIAGVTIPDTELCNAAVDLLEASSPEFLCTHCFRTYIFGSLAVRGIGRSVVDERAAFCGAVLHDLGLVPAYLGGNRFEVDGADAAREFCSKHQVSPERADLVWEAIALHTSVGIAISDGSRDRIGPPDYDAAETFWSPGYTGGPKGYIDYDYPEFSRT